MSDAPSSDGALGTGASATASGWYDFWIRRGWRVWLLAVAVFVIDQLSKALVSNWLRWGDSWPEEGWLRLTHARNTGAAFSLLEGQSTLLSIVSLGAIVLILWLYRVSGNTSLMLRIALALQLGGAFGNLLDRVRQGYVVDFFDVGPWPIFNVADSSISVGIALLLGYVFLAPRGSDRDAPSVASVARAEAADATAAARYCEACYRRRAHVQRLELAARAAEMAAAESAAMAATEAVADDESAGMAACEAVADDDSAAGAASEAVGDDESAAVAASEAVGNDEISGIATSGAEKAPPDAPTPDTPHDGTDLGTPISGRAAPTGGASSSDA